MKTKKDIIRDISETQEILKKAFYTDINILKKQKKEDIYRVYNWLQKVRVVVFTPTDEAKKIAGDCNYCKEALKNAEKLGIKEVVVSIDDFSKYHILGLS